MLSKSFETVKPLRPMFLPQNPRTQKASVMCDTRWSQRPLYEFVLDINLPAAEKLVLLSVASYRGVDTNKFIHFGIIQPNVHDLQEDTGLPQSTVEKILKVLYDAGYITTEAMVDGSETYIVEHSLPLFFEYFSLSRLLNYMHDRDEGRCEISLQLDKVSSEIRESLSLDAKPLERIARLYPGLYRTHIQLWLRIENARAIKSVADKEVCVLPS